jgi:hypothetical protein
VPPFFTEEFTNTSPPASAKSQTPGKTGKKKHPARTPPRPTSPGHGHALQTDYRSGREECQALSSPEESFHRIVKWGVDAGTGNPNGHGPSNFNGAYGYTVAGGVCAGCSVGTRGQTLRYLAYPKGLFVDAGGVVVKHWVCFLGPSCRTREFAARVISSLQNEQVKN